MTESIPLIKSHPSARVRQLLASADLDRPSAGGKQRTLDAVSSLELRPSTTNFSGIALGTTVHRLIGAVTVYGGSSSPLQWIARGSAVGLSAGALMLLTIVTWRWVESGHAETQPQVAAYVAERVDVETQVVERLDSAERELKAGRPEAALQLIDGVLGRHPRTQFRNHAIVLKVKALVALRRLGDAEAVAQPILVGSNQTADELRAILSAAAASQAQQSTSDAEH